MYFDSVAAALQMDGHGGFVWSAYVIALLVIALLLVVPLRREKRLIRQLRAELRRRQRRDGN
jgi:heme exporter protein D